MYFKYSYPQEPKQLLDILHIYNFTSNPCTVRIILPHLALLGDHSWQCSGKNPCSRRAPDYPHVREAPCALHALPPHSEAVNTAAYIVWFLES